MLVKIQRWEEVYSGKNITNLKVKGLKDNFYYIQKNKNGVTIILHKVGYVRKKDYRIIKLYNHEFKHLKEGAIKNINNTIDDLNKEFNSIVDNHKEILNENNNELFNLLVSGHLHRNNRRNIDSLTNNKVIIDFIKNYMDYTQEKYAKSIFQLYRIKQEIIIYKEILKNMHNIRYSDIM